MCHNQHANRWSAVVTLKTGAAERKKLNNRSYLIAHFNMYFCLIVYYTITIQCLFHAKALVHVMKLFNEIIHQNPSRIWHIIASSRLHWRLINGRLLTMSQWYWLKQFVALKCDLSLIMPPFEQDCWCI